MRWREEKPRGTYAANGVERYDSFTERASAWAGKHTFDINYSGAGALRSVQEYNPAEHLEHEEDYLERVGELIDYRISVLEEEPETRRGTAVQLLQSQLDEAGYIGEKIGAGIGGALSMGAFYATGSPFAFLVGAGLLITVPEGRSNLNRVSAFLDDREEQRQYYEEAKQMLEEDGVNALEDEISTKIHIPIPFVPTRHIDLVREDDVYYECGKVRPGETDATDARHNQALIEGYTDFYD